MVAEYGALQYGRPFVFWFGPRPRLVVSGPEVAKAVLTDSTGTFRKGSGSNVNPLSRQPLGEGLVALTGEKWAHHRRVISPAFNMERIKVATQEGRVHTYSKQFLSEDDILSANFDFDF
uniref:Secologanin synthase n=1 Tax=Aegilops tauschii TaxID=37682 RepID=M8BLL8_AEGTA